MITAKIKTAVVIINSRGKLRMSAINSNMSACGIEGTVSCAEALLKTLQITRTKITIEPSKKTLP